MSDRGSHVVVVGAGIVGAAAAYELTRRGFAVTLVEAERPAWGASGRNPGYVWLHTRSAGIQMELALAGRRLYDDLITELDDFEFRACGGMTYFFEEHEELFAAFVEDRRAAGLPMELLDRGAARDACSILPDSIAGATFNPLDAHIHTQRLVDAFVAAAERNGAKLLVDRVTAVSIARDRCVGIETEISGRVRADVTVIAAGVWSGPLLDAVGVRIPIVPMRLQVIETPPIDDIRFEPILYGPTAIKQYSFARELPSYDASAYTHPRELVTPGTEMLELAAQRRDGRILLGCPMDFPGLDDRTTVGGIGLALSVLSDHVPALRDLPIARTWAGLLPETPDALPVIGQPPQLEGLHLATGHVFGNAAGPITGRVVAELIAGEPTAIDIEAFRVDRPALMDGPMTHGRW